MLKESYICRVEVPLHTFVTHPLDFLEVFQDLMLTQLICGSVNSGNRACGKCCQ